MIWFIFTTFQKINPFLFTVIDKLSINVTENALYNNIVVDHSCYVAKIFCSKVTKINRPIKLMWWL